MKNLLDEDVEPEEIVDPISLFDHVRENINEEEFEIDSEPEEDGTSTPCVSNLPPSIILRLLNPNYNPIDSNPNFWKPKKYIFNLQDLPIVLMQS
jgi:hypothetical protein